MLKYPTALYLYIQRFREVFMRKKFSLKVLGISIYDKLSTHFTLKEMLFSNIAIRFNIRNIPDKKQVDSMRYLCVNLLEPIREGIRKRFNNLSYLIITSGFRNKKVNYKAGGSKKSKHMSGQASDFYVTGVNLFDVFQWICASGLEFDQII